MPVQRDTKVADEGDDALVAESRTPLGPTQKRWAKSGCGCTGKSHDEPGLQPLKMGVGVHYGAAVAGNVGTLEHAQYTIIGDVVNLAARLESATKDHNVELLFSRDLVDAAADDIAVRAVGTIVVRGRNQAIEVFTLA